MFLFSKSFSVSILFSVSIKNHQCYPNKEKCKTFLFIAAIFPVIDPNEYINTL